MYSACACTVSCLACSTRFTAIRKSLLLASAVWTSPRKVSSWNTSHHGRSASEAASAAACPRLNAGVVTTGRWYFGPTRHPLRRQAETATIDRKSTRLNSSHLVISYAVFCLKKKQNLHSSKNFILPFSGLQLIIKSSTNLKFKRVITKLCSQ